MALREETGLSLPPRRLIGWEIFVVFAVSLGASGLNALIELIGSLTAPQSLRQQQALLATFGSFAFRETNLQSILNEAADASCEAVQR